MADLSGNRKSQEREGITKHIAREIATTLNDDNRNSCNILLAGPWGSGKTTVLDALRDDEALKDKFHILIFSPWETMGSADPVVGFRRFLAYHLEDVADNTKDGGRKKRLIKTVRLLMGTHGEAIYNEVLNFVPFGGVIKTMLPPSLLNELFGLWKGDSGGETEKKHESEIDKARSIVFEILKDITPEGKRTLLLVDDMDRCRPEQASAILDGLYHFFLPQADMLSGDKDESSNSRDASSSSDNYETKEEWPLDSVWAVNALILEELLYTQYINVPSFRVDAYVDKIFNFRINLPPLTSEQEANEFWETLFVGAPPSCCKKASQSLGKYMDYPILNNLRLFRSYLELCHRVLEKPLCDCLEGGGNRSECGQGCRCAEDLVDDLRILLLCRGFPGLRDHVLLNEALCVDFVNKMTMAWKEQVSYQSHPIYKMVHDHSLRTLMRDIGFSVFSESEDRFVFDSNQYGKFRQRLLYWVARGV